jgi:mono/diheme cytochrome c family protein
VSAKWVRAGLLGLLLVMASSLPAADLKAPPWDDSQLNVGRDLFRENCAVCHDIDKDRKQSRKLGPSLNHLFKNERMPMSHALSTKPYVVVRIKYGGALMPAFGKWLSQSEIDLLVEYLASK